MIGRDRPSACAAAWSPDSLAKRGFRDDTPFMGHAIKQTSGDDAFCCERDGSRCRSPYPFRSASHVRHPSSSRRSLRYLRRQPLPRRQPPRRPRRRHQRHHLLLRRHRHRRHRRPPRTPSSRWRQSSLLQSIRSRYVSTALPALLRWCFPLVAAQANVAPRRQVPMRCGRGRIGPSAAQCGLIKAEFGKPVQRRHDMGACVPQYHLDLRKRRGAVPTRMIARRCRCKVSSFVVACSSGESSCDAVRQPKFLPGSPSNSTDQTLPRSLHEAQRHAGRALRTAALVPDFASLPPGYAFPVSRRTSDKTRDTVQTKPSAGVNGEWRCSGVGSFPAGCGRPVRRCRSARTRMPA